MVATNPIESHNPARQSRSALIVGFVLVLIGGGALVSQFFPDFDRYVPLAIGLGLLAAFFVTRWYAALILGGILTGVGAGLVVADLLPGTKDDGPGAVLGLAFGFIGIWVIGYLMRVRENHFWPLIPGGILLLVGSGLTLDLFDKDASRWIVPAIVVGIGVIVMVAGYLRMGREGGATTD
jgi:hypothetical protein